MSTPSQRGRNNRRKGSAGERELAALLSEAFGRTVKRRLGQAREGGADIVDLPPFIIEAKRRRRIGGLYQWMAQAQSAADQGEMPCVALRADGRQWLIVFELPHAIRLMRGEL